MVNVIFSKGSLLQEVSKSTYFQRSINKTCCSSEDKFIIEDTMAKVLQFIQKLCLQVLFTGGRGSAKGK